MNLARNGENKCIKIFGCGKGGLHGFQFGRMELPNFQNLATTNNKFLKNCHYFFKNWLPIKKTKILWGFCPPIPQ